MNRTPQKAVIAEEQVRKAFRRGRLIIEIKPGDIVTDQARDTAERLNIKIQAEPLQRAPVVRTTGAKAARRILYRNHPSWEPPTQPIVKKQRKIEKLTIVGAGGVGSNLAHLAANSAIAREIALVDILPGAAAAVALDLQHARGVSRSETKVIGSTSLQISERSQVVVVTAGRPRTPGMDRSDLSQVNGRVIRSIGEAISQFSPEAAVIVVSNPVEEMTAVMLQAAEFPRERIIGMAGTLDSARFKDSLAAAAGVSILDVEAMTLGSHGDEMVPLASKALIRDRPLGEFLNAETIAACQQQTIGGGAAVVQLRKTGSATLAPAHATLEILEYMCGSRVGIVPVSVLLDSEYGLSDVVLGVPCKLSMGGVAQIIEMKLTAGELAALQQAAAAVRRRIPGN